MPHGVDIRRHLPAFRKFLDTIGQKDGKTFMKLTVVGEYVDRAVAHAIFVCKAERASDADPLLSMTPYAIVQHFNAICYESRLEEGGPEKDAAGFDRAMARSVSTFILNPEVARLLMPHVLPHCNIVEAIGYLDQMCRLCWRERNPTGDMPADVQKRKERCAYCPPRAGEP